METPALAAERLLLGLGFTLLLVTGFALIDGRLPPAECPETEALNAPACTAAGPEGWILPGAAAFSLALGGAMRFARGSGDGPLLPGLFPDETEADVAARLAADHEDADDADRLTGDWARMEAKMLGESHPEEE